MGRRIKPLKDRRTNLFNFQYPLRDPEAYGVMEEFIKIAKREGVTFDKICQRALQEYVDKHGPGNSQTLLTSWAQDGHKSQAQAEAEILAKLKEYHEVSHALIRDLVKDRLGLEGQELVQVLSRISKAWRSQGGTVWI